MRALTASARPGGGRAGAPVRQGFTLLEVLLSIAIVALVATVLVGGSARLLSEQPASVEDVFWQAVQEARKTALKAGHEIRLKFDPEKKQFVLVDGLSSATVVVGGLRTEEFPLKTFPLPPEIAADAKVEFLGAGSRGGNTILVGGVLLEAEPLKFVRFFADGTCAAFRAQVQRGGGAFTLAVDPWTCAPILTPADPNAPPS